jgi:dynein heavy chain
MSTLFALRLGRHEASPRSEASSLPWQDGSKSRTAVGMYSGEGEYVGWHESFVCEGAVEAWLAGLLEAMRGSIKYLLRDAAAAYDEKPREKWLLEQCAQVVTVVTRIIYTQDVFDCFEQVRGGAGVRKRQNPQIQTDKMLVECRCEDLETGTKEAGRGHL